MSGTQCTEGSVYQDKCSSQFHRQLWACLSQDLQHADQRIRGSTASGQVSQRQLINTPNLTTDFSFFLQHLLSVRANLLNGAGVYLEAFSSRRHSMQFLKPISDALWNKFALHLAQKSPTTHFFPSLNLNMLFVSRCVNQKKNLQAESC